MADEDTPQTPDDAQTPGDAQATNGDSASEGTETSHAVPTDEAAEIAGSTEDAALEALQEAEESPNGPVAPEPVAVEPAGEGHAVPSEDAMEIAGSAEDAALEALQEAEDAVALEAAEAEDDEEEPAPREKPAVPGAHLEVDIVPEGVDPLGREQSYEDPYALEEDVEATEQTLEDGEEAIVQPIATAAIDLASGARYRATGKRKTAIARVTLRPGTGTYLVNGRVLEQHFPRITLQRNIRQPLEAVGYEDRMDVVARLHGGGISAQAGALRHGVSRALLEADPNLRGELKRRGFLTRDSRAKERKKAGLKKARKRPQFSKR